MPQTPAFTKYQYDLSFPFSFAGDVYLEWLHLRYLYLAPSDEVLTLLRNLRNNYYLALITNGPSKSQWEKISRLELADYFHCILVSGDLPWEKPSKKIFLEACLHLRVSPEECIMVGDKLETDILGAVKASLGGSVWIPLSETKGNINININNNNNNNNSNNNGLVSPDFTIADVTQLPYLLPANPKSRLFNFRCPPLTRRFLTVSDPDLEDCNSNSSDGS